MEYKRTIRFQYYQLRVRKYNKNEEKWGTYELFDFVGMLKDIDKENLIRKNIDFNGILARIECFSYDEESDLWGVRFIKLRDTNIPTKVKGSKEAEAIHLEQDEYIGEDVTMLYEKCSGIAMIQSNRFSLSISKIEEFLSTLYNDTLSKITIDPISLELDTDKFGKHNYRYIELSFANIYGWNNRGRNKKTLSSLIMPIKEMGGITGHITISLGHSKIDTLNKPSVNKLVNEIKSNRRFIRSAKIKVRDDDDTDTEVVDLFDDIYHDFIEFTLKSRESLKYEEAINSMIYKFEKKRPKLYNAIAYVAE